MKKKRFRVEQIVGVLKQAQLGVPLAEVIRKAGIVALHKPCYGYKFPGRPGPSTV